MLAANASPVAAAVQYQMWKTPTCDLAMPSLSASSSEACSGGFMDAMMAILEAPAALSLAHLAAERGNA